MVYKMADLIMAAGAALAALFGIIMAQPEQLSQFAMMMGVATRSRLSARHQAAQISRALLITWCVLVAIYLFLRRRDISAAFVASRKLWAARRWERELRNLEASRDAREAEVQKIEREDPLPELLATSDDDVSRVTASSCGPRDEGVYKVAGVYKGAGAACSAAEDEPAIKASWPRDAMRSRAGEGLPPRALVFFPPLGVVPWESIDGWLATKMALDSKQALDTLD
jgi:hypothetical protein